MLAYDCPRCRHPLGDTRAGTVRVYPCEHCGGHAITLAQLRSVSEISRFQAFWQAARAAPKALLSCPSCNNAMRAAVVSGVEVDACISCHLVWLDPGEQEKLVGTPPPARSTPADQRLAQQLLAIDQSGAAQQQRQEGRRGRNALRVVGVLLELMWWV